MQKIRDLLSRLITPQLNHVVFCPACGAKALQYTEYVEAGDAKLSKGICYKCGYQGIIGDLR